METRPPKKHGGCMYGGFLEDTPKLFTLGMAVRGGVYGPPFQLPSGSHGAPEGGFVEVPFRPIAARGVPMVRVHISTMGICP